MSITAQTWSNGETITAAKLNTIHNNVLEAAKQGQPKNLVDNSRFGSKWMVNQRGATSYPAGYGHAFDRWRVSASNCSVVVNEDYITITGGTARGYLQQFCENSFTFPITLVACEANGTIRSRTITQSGVGVTLTNGTIFGMANEHQFTFYTSNTNGSDNVRWVAAYQGTYAENHVPPYVYKGYAEELNECRRYFYKSPLVYATAFKGKNSINGYPFPVIMRAVPTWTVFDETGTAGKANVNNVAIDINWAYIREDGIGRITRSSGVFDDNLIACYRVECSAELST